MESLLIVFFFTVRLLVFYDMLFSVGLECLGSCLARWWACLLVGGREVVFGVPSFGKWFLFASCGVYGHKGMQDALRTLRDLWRILRLSFLYTFHLDSSLACSFRD